MYVCIMYMYIESNLCKVFKYADGGQKEGCSRGKCTRKVAISHLKKLLRKVAEKGVR